MAKCGAKFEAKETLNVVRMQEDVVMPVGSDGFTIAVAMDSP